MDLTPLLLSVCVMTSCLLGPARCSSDKPSCPCPDIPPPPNSLASPPPQTCSQIGATFRYTCSAGYLRKAGTSSLITCKQTNSGVRWTPAPPTLQCIPDPRRSPTLQPPTRTPQTASTGHHTSLTLSPSAAAGPEPTSPGPQLQSERSEEVGHVWTTRKPEATTSKSAATSPSPPSPSSPSPSSSSSSAPDRAGHSGNDAGGSDHTKTALAVFFPSLVIVSLLIVSVFCWCSRKRTKADTPEEVPMNRTPPDQDL